MSTALSQRRILVTGIADENSLALEIARVLQREGAELVCAGLGPTSHQTNVSEAGKRFLAESQERFEKTVSEALGSDVPTVILDASLDASLVEMTESLARHELGIDGVVHAIAMDRTIRGGVARPLIDVTREEFLDCMSISAYSLIGLLRALIEGGRLREGGSVVSLSYLGAERVMSHAYRNIGVAKAALERITRELALELGRSHGIRVNAVRFSAFAASRAGGAIPDLAKAVERAAETAPLGNASPEALALEVVHLMRPGLQITGEVRHVDGGYNTVG